MNPIVPEMEQLARKPKKNFFETLSSNVAKATGSTAAFILACTFVLLWALTGPIFHYSENWQLVINTATTIITFLMVFLIQKVQNKDSLAIQLKLNELVAAHEMASNRLVNVEGLSEDELKIIQKYYSKLSEFTKNETNLQQSHSIDEAQQNAAEKSRHEREELANSKSQDHEVKTDQKPDAKRDKK